MEGRGWTGADDTGDTPNHVQGQVSLFRQGLQVFLPLLTSSVVGSLSELFLSELYTKFNSRNDRHVRHRSCAEFGPRWP